MNKQTQELLNKLGISEEADATLPLVSHIVDCIAVLRDVVSTQQQSSNAKKQIGSKTYGEYMSKLMVNSLGRAVTHIVTSDFTEKNEKIEKNAEQLLSKQAIDGYHSVCDHILDQFPNFAQVKGNRGDKMLIHHAAYKHAAKPRDSQGNDIVGECYASKSFEITFKKYAVCLEPPRTFPDIPRHLPGHRTNF